MFFHNCLCHLVRNHFSFVRVYIFNVWCLNYMSFGLMVFVFMSSHFEFIWWTLQSITTLKYARIRFQRENNCCWFAVTESFEMLIQALANMTSSSMLHSIDFFFKVVVGGGLHLVIHRMLLHLAFQLRFIIILFRILRLCFCKKLW